jgi:hypothetical protein
MVINMFILSLGRCYGCLHIFFPREWVLNSKSTSLDMSKYCTFMSLWHVFGLFDFHIIIEEIPTINMMKCDPFWPRIINVHLVWHAQRVMRSSKSTLCTHFTPPLKLVYTFTIILLSSTCFKVVDWIGMVATNVVHCNLWGLQEEYQVYLYHTKTTYINPSLKYKLLGKGSLDWIRAGGHPLPPATFEQPPNKFSWTWLQNVTHPASL